MYLCVCVCVCVGNSGIAAYRYGSVERVKYFTELKPSLLTLTTFKSYRQKRRKFLFSEQKETKRQPCLGGVSLRALKHYSPAQTLVFYGLKSCLHPHRDRRQLCLVLFYERCPTKMLALNDCKMAACHYRPRTVECETHVAF